MKSPLTAELVAFSFEPEILTEHINRRWTG
jgi:hypothetical protein